MGEALRDNASDIHLEPYEQRCRIRMRIDGKLAERYVVERAPVSYTHLDVYKRQRRPSGND